MSGPFPNPPGTYYKGPRGSSTLYSRYLGGVRVCIALVVERALGI